MRRSSGILSHIEMVPSQAVDNEITFGDYGRNLPVSAIELKSPCL